MRARTLILPLILSLPLTRAGWASVEWYVREVAFQGNQAFGRKVLLERMVHRPSRRFDKRPYSRRVLEDDLASLLSFYRNQGYLEAKVELKEVRFDSAKRRVDIGIAIEEGRRTTISDVAIFGNQVFPDSFYLALIETRPGQPLLSARIDQDVRRILDALALRGYLTAQVSPEVRLQTEPALAVVEFTVLEGPQVRVAGVRVVGLERVKLHAVQRELRFQKGQVLRLPLIRDSISRLYRTGLFRSVEITPSTQDSANGWRTVIVRVSELDFGQVEGGIGFGTYDKVRASVEASYGNLFGDGRKVGFAGRASFVRQKAELAYSDPWAFGMPLRLDGNGYYEHHNEESYEAVLSGLRLTLGTQSRRRHVIRLTLREEAVRWLKLLGQPPGNVRAKNTRSLGASYAFDVRDDLFNPSKGTYFLVQGELAGLGGPGTNQFGRLLVEWRRYRPWERSVHLSSAVRFGWVQEYGLSTEVPIQERFFAGGAKSVRGFGERQLGPTTADGIPLGGRVSLIVNLVEARFPIWKNLGGAVFVDAGNVWADRRSFSPDRLRWAAGAGLRVSSPIGVLRLDFGLRLDRRPGEPAGAILLDMGQAF
ncbi:MAG: outer membrane protein assembly factor BamA [candidate division KSB1 bacterium]|nr:outer membrane protein assembly factor BamA [candidate division KSB1 bacterium]